MWKDVEDLALLEARDLLFARLLQYRAYKQVAALFVELEASALRRYPRSVSLEPRYAGLCPRSCSAWMRSGSPSWPPRCSGPGRRRRSRWSTCTPACPRCPSTWPVLRERLTQLGRRASTSSPRTATQPLQVVAGSSRCWSCTGGQRAAGSGGAFGELMISWTGSKGGS